MKNTILGLMAILSVGLSYGMESQELVYQLPEQMAEQETFFMHNIAVLTRIEVEVEVPLLAKVTLKPEIELQWTR